MSFTRRDFLKLAGLGAGAMALRPFSGILRAPVPIVPMGHWEDFPKAEHLGRLTQTLGLYSAPRVDYTPVGKVYEDTVVEWRRAANGERKDLSVVTHHWVGMPDGPLFSTDVQPGRQPP